MKIQLLSDLHLEFGYYHYCPTDADIVILAGDIHVGEKALEWIKRSIADKPVIYVLGNHEYYRHSYPQLVEGIKQAAQDSHIHVLEKDLVTIDGVNFLGCTLWTDFALFDDPRVAGFHCQQVMNDYKKIRLSVNDNKVNSVDIAHIHHHSLKWLGEQLSKHQGQQNVVVSHHGPTMQSVPLHRQKELTSAGYVSELSGFINHHMPVAWVHGHLHTNADYYVGNCRVMANPRGYPDTGNLDFNDQFYFEV